jgi:hypothetical protein
MRSSGPLLTLLFASACTPSSTASRAEVPPAAARAPGTPLVFSTPEGWSADATTNSMRHAQYRVPRVEGDGEDAECVVYYFGANGGGGVEPNLERWCTQFEQPDGSDSHAALVRSHRTVAGMAVHEVELSGTFVAETTPGSGVRVNKPGFALRGAILESDHGAYFVKLTGPAATVSRHASAFRTLVSGVR